MKTNCPELAAVLSFFIPGLGQIYNRERLKAVLFLLGTMAGIALCALLIGFFLGPMLWLWAVVDAYYSAQLINMGRRQSDSFREDRICLDEDLATLAAERS